MTKIKISFFAVLFHMATMYSSFAAPTVDMKCGYVQNDTFWTRYCLHAVATSKNMDVVYYFHGHGGSEYEWSNSPYYEQIYTQWGNNAPRVLSISYGVDWFLAEKNTSPMSGMFEHFTQFALPKIESDLKLVPAHRLLFGLSMGGFNAAQLYLKTPELFTKVALACPAINTLAPDSTTDQINAYLTRTNADSRYVYAALEMFGEYFPEASDWNQSDSIALAKNKASFRSPDLNVSCGDQDQYGFFEGAHAFADQVQARGGKVQWTLLHGAHCTFDQVAIANFLIQ